MPKRFRPTETLWLRLASTSQVGSLVLARPRPSIGSSMPNTQRAIVRAEIETRLAAAITYDEHGQSARSSPTFDWAPRSCSRALDAVEASDGRSAVGSSE